ncbi:MAG: major capsid protein [Pseudomonadota bacterium]
MPNLVDIMSDDAFGAITLTNSFMERDHVPGRAGELVFAGIGEGIDTDTVVIEVGTETLSVIPTRERGAPAQPETRERRKLHSMVVPHIPLDDRIKASEVRNVRQMGQTEAVQTVQQKLGMGLGKMGRRHDLTIENLRMGALLGRIPDADGTVLVNLFSTFGVTQPTAVSFELDVAATEIRGICQQVRRTMMKNAKTTIPASARIWAFAGDTFFDALIDHPNVKGVYDGYAQAARRLGDDYTYDVFEFGGIFFENYRGTDNADGSSNTESGGGVGIAPDECRFFWTGVPGLYGEYYSPGDFVDTVGSVGLPRYASVALDPLHGRFIDVHTEQNPLPICMRPKTLLRGTLT